MDHSVYALNFRKLNAKTVQNQHPIPRVQDALDSLEGSCWFSLLDQSKSSKVDTVQSLDSQDDVMGISNPHPHSS